MSAVATVPSCAPSIDPADHLGLVHHVLKRLFVPSSVDPEDLIQEGVLALCRAIRQYEPDRGGWASYAYTAIKRGMLNVLAQHRKRGRMFSEMDAVKVDGETMDYASTIPAPEEVESHHEEVALLLARLSPRDREVIELRFGLVDREPKSLEEVGRLLGITRERVRQIEERALTCLSSE